MSGGVTVNLQISKWGRPIVYIAEYYEKCIPGCAVEYVSNRIVLSTREAAIAWAKEQMALMSGKPWPDSWAQDPDAYPYYKNCDNPDWDPTFIATFGDWPGEPFRTVKVTKTEVCQTP